MKKALEAIRAADGWFARFKSDSRRGDDLPHHPFWVIVQKEVADHLHSWRFNILLLLLVLTCFGSLYTAMMSIREAVPADDSLHSHLFLKLFTVSDGTLPSFITFVGFLGPLLGIGLGFDAINSERNKGTLSRLLSQPIHRDYVLNAKFVAALLVISAMFFALGLLVMGLGILMIGIPPTPEEFWRIIVFLLLSVCYVAFWLNLAILFSVRFRQPATSALASIAVWIFFSVFFAMIVNLIATATFPSQADAGSLLSHQQFVTYLLRLSPSQLFSEATMTMLTPSIRSLGPLTMEQVYGAIPSPLPLGQSLLLIWPHTIGLIAATAVCFGISYVLFMRQEIRSR
ncbi:ABC transporter permease [Brevibacillus marinus]|uniref:ABC transporter permease n=1 Tax=Brevibacillus marinus TaxID=2496837 RepID=UPI000F834BC7|nr:ABC transporter permease [Brevibacillus marinus]